MKMRLRITVIVFAGLWLGAFSLVAQKRTVGAIAFYNVENLFDTIDDPNNPNDQEYTPDGSNKWDAEKYASKLDNIARVMSEMANGADIIGLSEIENLNVLNDLVAHPKIAKFKYQIVHVESPDYRGIDCALFYRPDRMKLLNFRAIRFPDPAYNTRDILHVKGLYLGDTLNVFVNHWPSRLGGKADKRTESALALRQEIDTLLAANPMTKIVVMGDLNDDPINKSVKKDLRAHGDYDKLEAGDLYNASADTFKQGYGTLMYKGTWNLFDQIIISQGMLKAAPGISYQPGSFSVFAPDYMREQSGESAGGPMRTFSRGVYLNGYSDHFPTYILIQK